MHYAFLNLADFDNPGYVRSVQLGAAMIRRGLIVSYIVDDTPGNRAFSKLDPKAKLVFVGPKRSPLNIFRRRRALHELAPDFVEVINPHPRVLLPLMKLNGPKVVTLWDESEFLKPHPPLKSFYLKQMAHWLMRRSDFHLCATIKLQELMRERFGMKSLYMPYATYLPKYSDGHSPYDRPTAAFLGNFYKDWDHGILFEAARILAQRRKKPPIVFMGGGPDEAPWRQFAQEHGLDNLTFFGPTRGESLWLRLRHAHVLLFPIRSTPGNWLRCPSKTFAYAQARRPTITNSVGEVAQMLGDAATYIECTPEAFADAIERAMDTPSLPDVDYGIEQQNYDERAERLLSYLRS